MLNHVHVFIIQNHRMSFLLCSFYDVFRLQYHLSCGINKCSSKSKQLIFLVKFTESVSSCHFLFNPYLIALINFAYYESVILHSKLRDKRYSLLVFRKSGMSYVSKSCFQRSNFNNVFEVCDVPQMDISVKAKTEQEVISQAQRSNRSFCQWLMGNNFPLKLSFFVFVKIPNLESGVEWN